MTESRNVRHYEDFFAENTIHSSKTKTTEDFKENTSNCRLSKKFGNSLEKERICMKIRQNAEVNF